MASVTNIHESSADIEVSSKEEFIKVVSGLSFREDVRVGLKIVFDSKWERSLPVRDKDWEDLKGIYEDEAEQFFDIEMELHPEGFEFNVCLTLTSSSRRLHTVVRYSPKKTGKDRTGEVDRGEVLEC